MTPEINTAIIQAYGIPGLLVAYLIMEWWKNRSVRHDPTKALFDKLDSIEKKVDQMDKRDDAIHDRLLRLETRDEMRRK